MLQAAVGEGQQRSVQGALGVLQNGIVLIDVLHYLGVELILLKYNKGKMKYCHNNSNLPYAFNMPAANLNANQQVGD